MGNNKIDLTNEKIGRWTVIEKTEKRNNNGEFLYICKCDCGNLKEVCTSSLRSKRSKSCGCLRIDKITLHNMTKSRTYQSWRSMISRCLNNNSGNYNRYGGRGIMVCKRWIVFENFLADMGERPEGMTLDRVNNNGNYELSNCKWSTHKEQANNRRKRNND